MSPWWLRPTAEGASESSESDGSEEPKSAPEPKPAPAPETPTERKSSRSGGRRGGGRAEGGGRPAERTERSEKPRADKPRADKPRAEKGRDDAGRPEKARAGSGRGAKPREEPSRADKGRADREPKRERPEPREERGAREDRSRPRARESLTFDDEISSAQIEAIRREMTSGPERNQSVNDERKIAMFCDLENIALGVRDSQVKKFDINLVLERLLEKGKIIVKKAYCDWERYSEYKRAFHEAAIEMIDIPQKYYSGKNSADIKMVVDAMDMSYAKEHLDTFVLLSGDSDFSPLVSKLKENNKYVIGIGVKGSSSNLLIDNCDEFIYYEDVWRDRQAAPKVDGGSANKKTSEAFALMVDAIQALLRENKDVLWGSMIKQTMQRKKPSFNEGYYGYSTFSELLEDAERNSLIKLKKDQRSGTYIVTGFSGRR